MDRLECLPGMGSTVPLSRPQSMMLFRDSHRLLSAHYPPHEKLSNQSCMSQRSEPVSDTNCRMNWEFAKAGLAAAHRAGAASKGVDREHARLHCLLHRKLTTKLRCASIIFFEGGKQHGKTCGRKLVPRQIRDAFAHGSFIVGCRKACLNHPIALTV